MKRIIFILTISTAALFTACNGDHTAKGGKDTVNSSYNSGTSNKDSVKLAGDSLGKDTSKTTASDATGTDNSGSGGTKVKDTVKKNK